MSSSPPLVSVVLPLYNGARFLREAVASIQSQTFQDFELLVWDDGSTDNARQLCTAIAAEDARIQIHGTMENRGLSAAMNSLAGLCRGRYVAIQEQDDISLPDRLAREVAILEADGEVGVVSGYADWIDAEGRVLRHFPGMLKAGTPYPQGCREMVEFLYLSNNKFLNAGCMIRRSLLEKIPGPYDPGAKIPDWQFILHAAHLCRIHGLVGDPVIRMRRGTQHQSLSAKREVRYHEARRCIRVIYRRYRNEPDSPVNFSLFRRAMSVEFSFEGMFYGSWKGVRLLLAAVWLHPGNTEHWRALWSLSRRGRERFLRFSGLKNSGKNDCFQVLLVI